MWFFNKKQGNTKSSRSRIVLTPEAKLFWQNNFGDTGLTAEEYVEAAAGGMSLARSELSGWHEAAIYGGDAIARAAAGNIIFADACDKDFGSCMYRHMLSQLPRDVVHSPEAEDKARKFMQITNQLPEAMACTETTPPPPMVGRRRSILDDGVDHSHDRLGSRQLYESIVNLYCDTNAPTPPAMTPEKLRAKARDMRQLARRADLEFDRSLTAFTADPANLLVAAWFISVASPAALLYLLPLVLPMLTSILTDIASIRGEAKADAVEMEMHRTARHAAMIDQARILAQAVPVGVGDGVSPKLLFEALCTKCPLMRNTMSELTSLHEKLLTAPKEIDRSRARERLNELLYSLEEQMKQWCTKENIEKVMGRKLPADEQKDADLAEAQREADEAQREAEREKQMRIEEERRHAEEIAELKRRYAAAQQVPQQAPYYDSYEAETVEEEEEEEEEIDCPSI